MVGAAAPARPRSPGKARTVIVPSYHFLMGPGVAVVALGLVVLICRWVFSTVPRDARTARRAERARSAGDYGLLVPVATVREPADAEMLRRVLRDAGIRGTVTPAAGGLAVLVFRADAEQARELVSR